MKLSFPLLTSAGLLLTLSSLQAAPEDARVMRPDFLNDSVKQPDSNSKNPGVTLYQGHVDDTSLPAVHVAYEAGQPKYELWESSFGQPGATYVPSDTYASSVLAAVRLQLYPAPGLSRAAIATSSAAFRAKFLMFGDAPNDGTPAIVNLFEQTFAEVDDSQNTWFNETDRAKIRTQIAVLRNALVQAPLDLNLRNALLDCYYDWAAIEMQFVRKYLARIATLRLGLPPAGNTPFIIDDEIVLMRKLVGVTEPVLKNFGELLSTPADVDPHDFDSRAPAGQPLGWYVFVYAQPFRNQTPTQYVKNAGSVADVVDPAQAAAATFSGFKDYRTLITVLGQFVQYKADLARLLGMRQGNGDLTEAREALTSVQGGAASDFAVMRNLFPAIDFNDNAYNSTSVRAAFAGVRTAFIESTRVRGFLNGTTNVLGLDENFLLLLPTDRTNKIFDTYDLLRTKFLTTDAKDAISTSALGVAKQKLNEAITSYGSFRESLDTVQIELSNLETDFKNRFLQITGYTYDTERAQWNGLKPKNNGATPPVYAPSELGTAERTIKSLVKKNSTLGEATLQLLDDIAKANEAITIASGANAQIANAVKTYQDKTAEAWTDIHTWAGAAAGSAAAADVVFATAGAENIFAGIATGIAGAANTAVQTAAAVITSKKQQEIENAALNFDAALAGVELPLAIQSARLELGALLREVLANKLEIEENMTALAQAMADRDGLLNEVRKIEEDVTANRKDLAGRWFADPIHYIRAERALITADREFRRAQRWLFFAVRALEYKWQERFASGTPGTGEWDAGSVLKMRNADELVEMFQKMEQWNDDREAASGPAGAIVNKHVISVRDHFLTPNPKDVNLRFQPLPADQDLRYDPITNGTIGKIDRFRQLLTQLKKPDGSIEIIFDTTGLQANGKFFAPGNYRDKIEWMAVNLVATDGPIVPAFNGRSGKMRYAGNTWFRTRVPLNPVNRLQGTTTDSSKAFDTDRDFPGEFIIAPFRYYQDTSFTGVFDLFDEQEANSLKFSYCKFSANEPDVDARIQNTANGFLIDHFKERSVAATRWKLIIDAAQVEIANLDDIEIIVNSQARERPQILRP